MRKEQLEEYNLKKQLRSRVLILAKKYATYLVKAHGKDLFSKDYRKIAMPVVGRYVAFDEGSFHTSLAILNMTINSLGSDLSISYREKLPTDPNDMDILESIVVYDASPDKVSLGPVIATISLKEIYDELYAKPNCENIPKTPQ